MSEDLSKEAPTAAIAAHRAIYHRGNAKTAFILAATVLALDGIMMGIFATKSESPEARQQAERIAIEKMIDKAGVAQKAEAVEAIRRNFSQNGLGGEFALAGKITPHEVKQAIADVEAAKVQANKYAKGVASVIGIWGLGLLGSGVYDTRRARRLEKTLSNG